MPDQALEGLVDAVLTSTSAEGGVSINGMFARLATALASGVNAAGNFVDFKSLLAVTIYPSNAAITVSSGIHIITKGTAAAMTLAPPTAGQAGTWMLVCSSTAAAHTVAVTEGYGGGGASFVTATFAAKPTAGFLLVAAALHWQSVAVQEVTYGA